MTLSDLPANTTDRLLAVADLLEAEPALWYQNAWVCLSVDDPLLFAGKGHCGTRGCIAGHAVMLTPADQLDLYHLEDAEDRWTEAGRQALGLDFQFAERLFAWVYRPRDVAAVLRLLAGLPERRTIRDAMAAGLSDVNGLELYDVDLRGLDLTGFNKGGLVDLWGAWGDADTRLPDGWALDDDGSIMGTTHRARFT